MESGVPFLFHRDGGRGNNCSARSDTNEHIPWTCGRCSFGIWTDRHILSLLGRTVVRKKIPVSAREPAGVRTAEVTCPFGARNNQRRCHVASPQLSSGSEKEIPGTSTARIRRRGPRHAMVPFPSRPPRDERRKRDGAAPSLFDVDGRVRWDGVARHDGVIQRPVPPCLACARQGSRVWTLLRNTTWMGHLRLAPASPTWLFQPSGRSSRQ
jgi:hypothetical protein